MTVISSPEGLEYAGLATLKSQFRMEKVGLTHSAMRGKKLRPMWAKHLGLKPRDTYEDFIAEIQRRMDAILASVAPVGS